MNVLFLLRFTIVDVPRFSMLLLLCQNNILQVDVILLYKYQALVFLLTLFTVVHTVFGHIFVMVTVLVKV